jgi:hypothetical protein
MEWTKANTLHFTELYRSKEMLWNAKHPRHFNKILRNDAWEELASKLNKTAEEFRKKMTGLLASLRREIGKMKKSARIMHVNIGCCSHFHIHV